jgi:hypothetical protein
MRFSVRSDGAPDAFLYTLTDGSATPSDDYSNRRMVETWGHCRVLIGATEDPPRDCPSNWWDMVDRLAQPVVWSDGDGLASSVRVLLPYQRRRRIRATIRYAAAIRILVYEADHGVTAARSPTEDVSVAPPRASRGKPKHFKI